MRCRLIICMSLLLAATGCLERKLSREEIYALWDIRPD